MYMMFSIYPIPGLPGVLSGGLFTVSFCFVGTTRQFLSSESVTQGLGRLAALEAPMSVGAINRTLALLSIPYLQHICPYATISLNSLL